MDERGSLITSQIDTAPKHLVDSILPQTGLITSQIDTAPKQDVYGRDDFHV